MKLNDKDWYDLHTHWKEYVGENNLFSQGLICWNPTGSYYTFVDKSKAKDVDVICFIRDHTKFNKAVCPLFEVTSDGYYKLITGESLFITYKGFLIPEIPFNLIVTMDNVFYSRFVAATLLCKQLNIEKKEDRIAMFKLVMGDKT